MKHFHCCEEVDPNTVCPDPAAHEPVEALDADRLTEALRRVQQRRDVNWWPDRVRDVATDILREYQRVPTVEEVQTAGEEVRHQMASALGVPYKPLDAPENEQCRDHDRQGIDLRPEGAPWAPSTYHCILRQGHDGPPEYRDVAL